MIAFKHFVWIIWRTSDEFILNYNFNIYLNFIKEISDGHPTIKPAYIQFEDSGR